MTERETEEGQAERESDEGYGASGSEAEDQAGTPGQEGQGDDDQATGNPANAGED